MWVLQLPPWSVFQLTHPWGCDNKSYRKSIKNRYFNSHTREGVTKGGYLHEIPQDFNSHTREGVTPTPWDNQISWFYFNSHTREGVTIMTGTQSEQICTISTHTPVRVWHPSVQGEWDLEISTHTPVRVWRNAVQQASIKRHFNSHTREGVTNDLTIFTITSLISTHTPVRVWPYI